MRMTTFKHFFKILMCCLLSFLFLPTIAQSAIVLDQITVNPETLNGASAVGKIVESNSEVETAQTVTTGISGFLSKIDLWVGRQSDTTGDMVLNVLNSDISPDTGEPLLSVIIPATSISPTGSSMVSVDIRNANILFNTGDKFAIALSAPNAQTSTIDFPPFYWSAQGPGQYDNGLRFYRDLQIGPSWVESSVADQALRTWVEPIPEPATLSLLTLGVMLTGRKRKT